MDFVSGIPTTKAGNDTILVVVCRLTKRAHFIPTRSTTTTEDIAEIFMRDIVRLHGVPDTLVSDRDIKFTNTFWRALHAKLGVRLNFSTVDHPETDGQTERVNKILEELLRSYVQGAPLSWDKQLPLVEFAYNNSYQSSVECTPFYADLGYEPKFISILHEGLNLNQSWKNMTLDGEAFALVQSQILHRTQEFMAAAQETQSRYVNRHRSDINFKEGERVLLHKHAYGKLKRNSKLQQVYFGPFTILKRVNDNAYTLDMGPSYKKHVTFNIRWLRKFIERGEDYARLPPQSQEDIKNKINQVVSILRVDPKEKTAEVQWEGCDPADTTRLPLKLLDELPTDKKRLLIRNYNAGTGR